MTTYYLDIHGNKIIHASKRVPCFDESDRLHDWRYWNWFYFVTASDKPKIDSLVAYFGDVNILGWVWIVYEGITKHNGKKMKKPVYDNSVFED